jgi:hypothetical protein
MGRVFDEKVKTGVLDRSFGRPGKPDAPDCARLPLGSKVAFSGQQCGSLLENSKKWGQVA